ncbi:hypothetical protein LJU02_00270 [Corynebacterium pseudotuberculosis]|uniref:hypothetical protein n=1 Tax=Corynebacterium pseudotuberculosis TaxID=1719 RepID=UPI001D05BCE9|nr:hypothetical protein [Corynebacterium pseudotuberculosis]UTO24536.1 hypothetical protein NMK91_00265 [Corynebacterium pseudotuberculosis]WAE78957.1 hypothetical protein LJU20_00270 [Corynebacterium pseudotuberculosis]WAE81005.1 hypothetical protein LJU19_00270 [Corynebacterium pseudotuberculosis]WAE83051.1 hypothetical protein LJU18_00270 [Corynebacterium pseudotuberculosis]WAE85099.1 hypothetical protein LJU17_00270 [Corynebacterium pseudotuberculosis]
MLVMTGVAVAPAHATEPVNYSLTQPQQAEKTQTVTYSDGTTVTGVLTEDGKNVRLYLNGEYAKTASLVELAEASKLAQSSDPNPVQLRSACGHILNGVAAANGMLWVAAGLSAGTANLPAAAVAGIAGVVTSGIIGIAGAEC